MKVTIAQKCDRSGRTANVIIESTEVQQYESRELRRQKTLKDIEEFFAKIDAEDMPDLVSVYRGKLQAFINVNPDFCGTAVNRLLEQLFHVGDPSARAPRKPKDPRITVEKGVKNNNTKFNKNLVKENVPYTD